MSSSLVKGYDRIRSSGEVFTPPSIVHTMLNINHDFILDFDHTILEPSCGEGVFLLDCLQRRIEYLTAPQPHPIFIGREFFRAVSTLYGVDIAPDNCTKTRESLAESVVKYVYQGVAEPLKALMEHIISLNIICEDFLNPGRDSFIYKWSIFPNPPVTVSYDRYRFADWLEFQSACQPVDSGILSYNGVEVLHV